tara:strand:+ start:12692 stop:15256 length:2565 start_codon:yes stop_codon:yes gene_type:complete
VAIAVFLVFIIFGVIFAFIFGDDIVDVFTGGEGDIEIIEDSVVYDGQSLNLTVKRVKEEGNLTGLRFLIENKFGESYIYEEEVTLNFEESKFISILTVGFIEDVTKVSIYPIFRVEQTQNEEIGNEEIYNLNPQQQSGIVSGSGSTGSSSSSGSTGSTGSSSTGSSNNDGSTDTGNGDGDGDGDEDGDGGSNVPVIIGEGWTEPVPTVYDISEYGFTDLNQPGSRIFYISNSGDDNTASIYFWDGVNIVDQEGSTTDEVGNVYGTDSMNPSDAVKPFKRWSYVAPRRGANEDVGSSWNGKQGHIGMPGGTSVSTRYEYPDWWLFKRGESFDLYEDFLSLALETNSSLEEINSGSLAVSGGKSETERQIVGAYGDLSEVRPRFYNPVIMFITRWKEPQPKHIAYLSLHFDGRGERRGQGFDFRYQDVSAVDILLEDLWIDGTTYGGSIGNTNAEITLRRVIITDAYKDSHSSHTQGLKWGANRDAKLRVEESILMRNGFSNGDPRNIDEWPLNLQEGDPDYDSYYYDKYNRNMYLSLEIDNMESGLFDSISLVGASPDQFRNGMRIERNFFYQGSIVLGANGGYPDEDGPTGSFVDNIVQRFNADGRAKKLGGQSGGGLILASGANQVEVARNILTSVQHKPKNDKTSAFTIRALAWECCQTFYYATRNNNIHDNIFDNVYDSSSDTLSAIKIEDGIAENKRGDLGWSDPGIKNNIIQNNVLINLNKEEWRYVPIGDAVEVNSQDTQFIDNTLYSSRDEAGDALDWEDPDRSLKTYLESIGVDVTSDDGYMEFFDESIQQRKGYWREEFTARPLVNYMREGFGMDELTGTVPLTSPEVEEPETQNFFQKLIDWFK